MLKIAIEDIHALVPQQVEPEKGSGQHAVFKSTAPSSWVDGRVATALNDFIPALRQDHTFLGASEGDWSLHQLIRHLFQLTGPASLSLSSWGLTEKPLKDLLDLVIEGVALKPKLLLDYRVKLQSKAAYQMLLASGLDIRTAQNHSKIVLILNKEWGITVITSSNLTRNPRTEFYAVLTSRSLTVDVKKWFDGVHAKGNNLT